MKEYIKKMRECNQKVADIMHEFVNALIEMVRAHDGFILTNGKDKDNICGYALDNDDELHEYDLLALRLIREDGCDEDYKSACAKYGWDLSLEQFVSEFNADGPFAPTNESHYIRIY